MTKEQIIAAGKDSIFGEDIYKYVEFASWVNWYPDLFLDLITPKTGSIKLHTDQRIYLRSIMRFVSLYGVFPRGWGKCVKGDTLVFTDNGIKEIGEFFEYNTSGKETYYNTEVSVINRHGKLEQTAFGLYNGKQKTKTITTKEGYQVTGTYNHPILVMNKDGEIEWKELQDVNVYHDYILINRNNGVWGKNTKIGNNQNDLRLDEDLSMLFGYFVSTLLDDKGIRSIDMTLMVQFYIFLTNFKKYFPTSFYYFDNHRYQFNDKFLHFLEEIDLEYRDKQKAEIPKWILTTTKENMSSFIRALFDIDGYVSDDNLHLEVYSEKLAHQIQVTLLNYNIISSIEVIKHDDNDGLIYNIYISDNNVHLFQQEIGFNVEYKRTLLNELCNRIDDADYNIIPYQMQRLYDIDCINHHTNLSYHALERLITTTSSDWNEYEYFKSLLEEHYYFAKIDSIQNGYNDVYDFHIPDTHSFISNGLISHNTFDEVLAMFIVAIRYPNITLSLSAQTKENAAKLLKDKTSEICRFYPLLEHELEGGSFKSGTSFSKNDAQIKFKSGAVISNLANDDKSKGLRRTRLNMEESALMNGQVFEDALLPIVEVSRLTSGMLSIVNPEELNQQINFFTTAGYRGTDEYDRSINMVEEMVNLQGKMVLGSNWFLGCWYGRGSSKKQILEKKKTMSMIAFAQNYESEWVGAVDGALVNINKLLACRVLEKPQSKREEWDDEYYMAIDVARSESTANNQSSAAICKVTRDQIGRVKTIDLVNMVHISNKKNFSKQALDIKRLYKLYEPEMVICDGNGIGTGLVDELLKDCIDPMTGESLGCWNTINTDNQPDIDPNNKDIVIEDCLYDLKAQGNQTRIISRFIDAVDGGKLKLLRKKEDSEFTQEDKSDYASNIVPFVETDFLIDEIANLKLSVSQNKLSVSQITRKINKDRWSALAYCIFYILEFCSVTARETRTTYDIMNEYTFV